MPARPVKFTVFWILGLACLVGLAAWLLGPGDYSRGRDKIGIVEVTGLITRPEGIIDDLAEMARDNSIGAIVVRIDSPGGGVAASQEIHREIIRAKARKKIVASLGEIAASGGYYVAVAADRIMADPGTTTGSFGVIMEMTNLEELLDKIGVRLYSLKAGRYKDIGSPVREMTPEERRLIQGVLNDLHDQFVTDIAAGRDMNRKEVDALADGRIFTGRQAQNLGLVDELGNFRDAVKLAADLAGLEGEPELVYPSREEPGWLKGLIRDMVTEGVSQLGLKIGPKFLFKP